MAGETEYIENMRNHQLVGRGKEPKLSQIKERVKPFDGNYSTVYQDLGQTAGDSHQVKQRACCTVAPFEKDSMLVDSVQRILQDPKMARQVFN